MYTYRDSYLKSHKNLIVLSTTFKLTKDENIEDMKKQIEERCQKRIATQPLNEPNAGSVFRNPDNMYAGELIEKSNKTPDFVKTAQLKKHLEQVRDKYDYIIIDCPPSLGILTTNALTASDSVIIPVQCEFFALEGIMQLLNTIMLVQKNLNPSLDIEGVLLTMLDARTKLGIEVVTEIRSYFKERVYDTIIPRLVKLSEAPSHGKPIHMYDSDSKGALAYLNLAKEVIERNGN